MVGSEQVGGHARVMVGDKWRWFGYDRGLGGGLGGGLEGEGGPHLPPVTVEVEGGGGPLPCEVVEGVHEQVDGGLGHVEGVVVTWGGSLHICHPGGIILVYEFSSMESSIPLS